MGSRGVLGHAFGHFEDGGADGVALFLGEGVEDRHDDAEATGQLCVCAVIAARNGTPSAFEARECAVGVSARRVEAAVVEDDVEEREESLACVGFYARLVFDRVDDATQQVCDADSIAE